MPFQKYTMSVHWEKALGVELSEHIESLQEELTSLKEQWESQTNDTEKERLEALISDIHAETEILAVVEPTSTTSQTVQPRKSSRERNLTLKMLELKQQEASQRERVNSSDKMERAG